MDDVDRVAGVMAQIYGHPPMRFFYNGDEGKNVYVKVLKTGDGLETRVSFDYVEPKILVDCAWLERLRYAARLAFAEFGDDAERVGLIEGDLDGYLP